MEFIFCDLCKENHAWYALAFEDGRPNKVAVCKKCMEEKYTKVEEPKTNE